MPETTDADKLAALKRQRDDIERDAQSLVGKVRFTEQVEEVTRRLADLARLHGELDRLHGRAFIWTAPILAALDGLEAAGRAALEDAKAESTRAARELGTQAEVLLRKVKAIQPTLAMAPAVQAIDTDRDTLKAQVEAVASRIEAVTRPFVERFDLADRLVRKAHGHMDRFEEGTFKLLPEENPVAAVKATWEDAPEGKIAGILFLTDLRLRFEQREKVAKKKFLFFTTESSEVKELELDAAVGHLLSCEDAKRGMVIKDQLLKITWSPEARVRGNASTFELDEGTAKEWDTVVEEIRSGAIARQRRPAEQAASPAGAPAGTPLEWPERCQACDAPMPPPVKGQTSIACPYCGQAHAVTIAMP